MSRPNLTYSAPVLSIVIWVERDEEVWPCPYCLPWHIDIDNNYGAGGVVVQEWHAAQCPKLLRALAEADAASEEHKRELES